MARSASRAATRAARSCAESEPARPGRMVRCTRQSGILSAAAAPRGLPRSASARARTARAGIVVHTWPAACCGDTESMRPRYSRHCAHRAPRNVDNSHGLTSAVRLTMATISCSFTASVPRRKRDLLELAVEAHQSSPTSPPAAAPSVSASAVAHHGANGLKEARSA